MHPEENCQQDSDSAGRKVCVIDEYISRIYHYTENMYVHTYNMFQLSMPE